MRRLGPAILAGALLLVSSGCTLLFVPKGGSRVVSAPPAAVPHAPSLQDPSGSNASSLQYRVAEGDTLESVARAFYGDSRQAAFLAKTNHLGKRGRLRKGGVLRIPATAPQLPAPERATPATTTPGQDLRTVTLGQGTLAYELEVSNARKATRPRVNRAFAAGERLKFAVHYFAVLGGYATLTVEALETFQGRPCYRLAAEAHSAFPFSNFYKVDDRLVSRFDAVDFFPWRFEKRVREGNYREAYAVDYRPLEHQAVRTKEGDPVKTFAVPPFVQDVISTFYYFRLVDFKVGDRVAIPTQAGTKNYELVVEVLGREKVSVPAGQYDCFLLKPHAKYDNVFQNKGEILLWVTADERRLPVKIRSKILIGSVDIDLLEADLPRLGG